MIFSRTERLWPDGDESEITFYIPSRKKACGSAVVVCPGGGYYKLSMDHEGDDIAKWLCSLGVAGIVLRYRHSGTGFGHPAPFADGQRAIRILRSQADEYNFDSNKIGILGFSAGGHLASVVGVHYKDNFYEASDSIDKVSGRPDFMILVYPAISLAKDFGDVGCRQKLLGVNTDKGLVEYLSSELYVTGDTPPSFLVHAEDDEVVPVENTVCFYEALLKAGVRAEMHIYEKGGHGFGFVNDYAISSWPDRCRDWMAGLGLLG